MVASVHATDMRTGSGVVVAVALGVLQGTVEWLPVSSEGFVSVAVTALGAEPTVAVRLALFLHLGTALSAAVFYREDLWALLGATRTATGASTPDERVGGPATRTPTRRDRQTGSGADPGGLAADRRFLLVATLVSGVVGVGAYLLLEELVSALTGGTFLALVGALLVGTGLLLRATGDRRRTDGGHADGETARAGESDPGRGWVPAGDRDQPDLVDAAVVGVCQGVAVLPGVSRSGTTVGALLLRGHSGPGSLRLSFLLSIPAAVGAAGLAVVDGGGLPTVAPAQAAVALAVAAVVGYLTVDLLTRLVRRVAFWGVCVGLGLLAVGGGVVAAV